MILKKKSKLITVADLKRDHIGSEIGFWPINIKIHKKSVRFIITGDNREGYTLAHAEPIAILGHADTLEDIVQRLNNMVCEIKTHDVFMVQNNNNTQVVIAK